MPSPVKIIHQRRRRSDPRLSHVGTWITWVITFMFVSFLGVAFLAGLLYVRLIKDLPPVGNIEILFTSTASGFLEPIQVYDRSNKKLFDLLHPAAADRQWFPLDGAGVNVLPKALQDAIVISHDSTFWSNHGYDLGSLIRNVFRGDRKENKSEIPRTITQRLVQMTILPSDDFLHTDLWRYLREAILAQRLTERYSKDQILEWYINSVEYGNLAYGADAAALIYFGKHASELTLAECAILAAISIEPTGNLFNVEGRARAGKALILPAMFEQGLITASQSQNALIEDIVFSEQSNQQDVDIQHYTFNRIVDALGVSITNRVGLYVFTTIDSEIQFQVHCAAEMLKHGSNGQDFILLEMPLVNGICFDSELNHFTRLGEEIGEYGSDELASVILDARTGEILSLDGPVDSPMPSTSMLYPFIYLSAFSKGSSPGTMVLDLPLDFMDKGRFEGTIAHGPILMRTALLGGYPLAVQRTIQSIGLENVLQVIQQMGVSRFYLGAEQSLDVGFPELYEISMMDTAYSYGILANSGKVTGTSKRQTSEDSRRFLDPIFIKEVRDRVGSMLYSANQGEQSIVSQELAFLVTDVLRDPAGRAMQYELSNFIDLDRPSAVISGTDQDGGLSWTIGYTPSIVVGVWVENRVEAETKESLMSMVSVTLWNTFMKLITQSLPMEDWQQPPGILQVEICKPSGLLPTTYCPSVVKEYFLEGTQPIYYDTFYQPFRINKETGKLATLFTPQDLIEEGVFLVPPPEAMEWAHDAGYLQPPIEYDTFEDSSFDDKMVEIDVPRNFDYIRGKKWISGRTNVDGFNYFRLQYGEGLNPTHWFQIGENQFTPVAEGTLALWDTTLLDGLYALQLIVVDQNGIAYMDTEYVTVDNVRPEVELICPDEAARIQRDMEHLFSCNVRVSDNIDIAKVEFYLDGTRINIDSTAPFSLQMEADMLWEGMLFARAYDLAGNFAQSMDIQISIDE